MSSRMERDEMGVHMHVTPVNDLREHVLSQMCPCIPRLAVGGEVIVHNAYDAREVGEVCRKAFDLMVLALATHNHDWSAEEQDALEHAIHVLDMHWTKGP